MTLRRAVLMLLVVGLVAVAARAPADKAKEAPKRVPPFKLTDPRGDKVIDLAAWKTSKGVAVVFVGTECPINNDFLPELARLHEAYSDKGVRFVGVNSNRQDTPARVAEHAKKHAIPFPVVKDPGNKVADLFGAKRTPEAFLLDGDGNVLYHGRIDDQFGVGYRRPGKPTRRDLACAIDEVLAGKAVSKPTTEVAGCFIGRVKEARAEGKVTYAKHVSRILQKNCQECHRPGQIGPMALLSYDDAVAWAETMREVLDDARMPPWFADPKYGKWANDRRLSKEDLATLRAWLDGGTPKGDDADLPPPRKFAEGWQVGEPDAVISMPKEYKVPAETPKGGVPYQYFSVPTDFKEDRWVVKAEARPGSPEVVHHIIVFIVGPGERFNPDGPGNVLCGQAPGDMPLVLPPGLAKKVPAGARLVFQMHYTPNGKAQGDRSSVGLTFAKEAPKHRVLTKPVMNRMFVRKLLAIPAGADNFAMEASHTFKDAGVNLVAFMPHMHLRGKDFKYEAIYADGKKETLLSVPRYNFNWQSVYRPQKPVALPKGTTLRCEAHFDNSEKNPHNPDATKRVLWGDQTWEEMMIGWIDYYEDGKKP
jgi:thiol-disulfide isomerase/thioredoxin/mono/diheme cytochrome c family protein